MFSKSAYNSVPAAVPVSSPSIVALAYIISNEGQNRHFADMQLL
jgi:hypothetical protein